MINKGVFIIGVRKCGTTSLFDILANHSQIVPCKHKEPQYYCMEPEAISEYRNWYSGLFKNNNGSFLLDGSTLYYQYPDSFPSINKDFAVAKYIICLRDPAMRFYSAYWHMKAKAQKVENRTLDEIIKSLGAGTSAQILKREDELLNKAVEDKMIDINYLDETYHYRDMMAPIRTRGINPLAFYQYYRESLYSINYPFFKQQTETAVVIFEKLLNQPEVELQKIHDFLGLEMEPGTSDLVENNNKTLSGDSALSRLIGKTRIFILAKTIFSSNVKYHIKKLFYRQIPVITRDQYTNLRILLNEEYEFWFNIYPELKELWTFKSK